MGSREKRSKKKLIKYPTTIEYHPNSKFQIYFTSEEIVKIKTILKSQKETSEIPPGIGATILNRYDLLKQLLNDGYHINETGQVWSISMYSNCTIKEIVGKCHIRKSSNIKNRTLTTSLTNNMTALTWAVKYKYVDIINYLLANGADPTIKTNNGDNILIIALEQKSWDEHSFINLWKSIEKISFIDINFTNKNSNSILHLAVKRDWESFTKLLIAEKPNIDASNSNGVTPLMIACLRNNNAIINILINAGADILKEDRHGRMALCYSISASTNISKPPFTPVDKMIAKLGKNSLRRYLKRRIQIIFNSLEKSAAISEIMVNVVQFAVHYTTDGLKILLDLNVFERIQQVIETIENVDITRFLLTLLKEMLFYNEKSIGFSCNTQKNMLENFFNSGLAEFCITFVKNSSENSTTVKLAINLLFLSYTNNKNWQNLLKENYTNLLPHLKNFNCNQQDLRENLVKTIKKKYKKMKKAIDDIQILFPKIDETAKSSKDENGGFNYSKRTKRRSNKAIKAKITKIKSAELTKRLKNKIDDNKKGEIKKFQQDNPIVCSFRYLLEQKFMEKDYISNNSPDWKNRILSLRFDNKIVLTDHAKISKIFYLLKNNAKSTISLQNIDLILDYLEKLLTTAIQKHEKFWRESVCNCHRINEHLPWYYKDHLKTITSERSKSVEELRVNFAELKQSIKKLWQKNFAECCKNILKLESVILNSEIRGLKMISELASIENLKICYTITEDVLNLNKDEIQLSNYIQNVLNDLQNPTDCIKIKLIDKPTDSKFLLKKSSKENENFQTSTKEEIKFFNPPSHKNNEKIAQDKLKTLQDSYHLIGSIMNICEESNAEIPSKPEISSKFPESFSPQLPTKESIKNRLISRVQNLQNEPNFDLVFNGSIKTCTKERYLSYIISGGINFGLVEVALDKNNQPLAVKRLCGEHVVAKMLLALTKPLLNVSDLNILQYYACSREKGDLILVTPLCHWNLKMYIESNQLKPSAKVGIIKQMLSGLKFLHGLNVVHGNLKPTNVFIDFNGVVKLAEFGIHEALYKLVRAPVSAKIWFSSETYINYNNFYVYECNLMSDIQVIGMLMHYILTNRKHPFGNSQNEVLRNIPQARTRLQIDNTELTDLLLWMFSYYPTKRPTIKQVMRHPFFWPSHKKWKFLLTCAGIDQYGNSLPIHMETLHKVIDLDLVGNFELDWIPYVQLKFPNIWINSCSNTTTGLLKFLKFYCGYRLMNKFSNDDIEEFILNAFPELPVLIFRILDKTSWIQHSIFLPFVTSDL